jgi:quercetin dioxygenase-like cupin family protein
MALSVVGLAGLYTLAVADETKFKGTVLEQVPLDRLNGDYIMKVTMLDMEPGAQIPEHAHKGPGLRYVIEGAHRRNFDQRNPNPRTQT